MPRVVVDEARDAVPDLGHRRCNREPFGLLRDRSCGDLGAGDLVGEVSGVAENDARHPDADVPEWLARADADRALCSGLDLPCVVARKPAAVLDLRHHQRFFGFG